MMPPRYRSDVCRVWYVVGLAYNLQDYQVALCLSHLDRFVFFASTRCSARFLLKSIS